jgi:hypothetical protein
MIAEAADAQLLYNHFAACESHFDSAFIFSADRPEQSGVAVNGSNSAALPFVRHRSGRRLVFIKT